MSVQESPLVIYEKALMPHEWSKMFDDTAELGFTGFEVSIDESDMRLARLDWDEKEYLPIIAAAKQSGIVLQSLCFSGQRRFPMGSADPAIVAKSTEMMKKCIRLCQGLGIRVLQVAGYDVFYEPASPDTYRRYIDNLARMTHIAEQHGVMLAIEPVESGVTSVTKALDIIHEIRSPYLQVYPDIANMASLGIDYFPEIEAGVGHIAQIHIRDALPNFFYGVDIGTGIIDFKKTFRLFDQLSLSCPLTLEMWNLENPQYMDVLRHAMHFIKSLINQSGKL